MKIVDTSYSSKISNTSHKKYFHMKKITNIGKNKMDFLSGIPDSTKIRIRESKHFLISGDSLQKLKEIPDESVDLIITDPPYNIGLDYGNYKDNLKEDEYFDWCKVWLRECGRILKKNGNLFLINYPERNAYLVPFLDKELKLIFKRWLTWHYPTNVGHSKKNFTRSQRSILYYSKSENNKFFIENILQPYKNPTDRRVKELIKNGKKGRKPYDALKISDIIELNNGIFDFFEFNIVKNVSKDKNGTMGHPCVMPKELIRVLINAGSKKGDIVLDPFSGAFTVSLAAAELGRNSIGIDMNPKYVRIGIERLMSFSEEK